MLSEASKRERIANALLGLSFAASAAHSPKDFVRTGHIESPGTALMQRWGRVRREAERNLDSGRVSHPARNRKKKNVSEETLKKFKKWWNKGRDKRVPNENESSWKELMKDDIKQITRTDKAFKSGEKGLKGWRPHKAFSPEMVRTGPTPAVRQAVERPIRALKKTFKEFVEESYLIEARQPYFSSRAELEKHHGGIPSGYYANNAGSTESPKWRLKPKEGGVKERKVRAERIAILSSDEEKKTAAVKANKLKKAGLEVHHITPLHHSAKLKSSMSDAEWQARVKRDAAQGVYHGHHPKNIMGATTEKTPESRSRRGISHRAGGAHELEGKTKDIVSGAVPHKELLSAAHRMRLRKEREANKK